MCAGYLGVALPWNELYHSTLSCWTRHSITRNGNSELSETCSTIIVVLDSKEQAHWCCSLKKSDIYPQFSPAVLKRGTRDMSSERLVSTNCLSRCSSSAALVCCKVQICVHVDLHRALGSSIVRIWFGACDNRQRLLLRRVGNVSRRSRSCWRRSWGSWISTRIANQKRLDNMMSTVARSEIFRTRTKKGCEYWAVFKPRRSKWWIMHSSFATSSVRLE